MRSWVPVALVLAGCGTSFDGSYEGPYTVATYLCSNGEKASGYQGTLSLMLTESDSAIQLIGQQRVEGRPEAITFCEKPIPINSKNGNVVSFGRADCLVKGDRVGGIESGTMVLNGTTLSFALKWFFSEPTSRGPVTCRSTLTADLVQTQAY